MAALARPVCPVTRRAPRRSGRDRRSSRLDVGRQPATCTARRRSRAALGRRELSNAESSRTASPASSARAAPRPSRTARRRRTTRRPPSMESARSEVTGSMCTRPIEDQVHPWYAHRKSQPSTVPTDRRVDRWTHRSSRAVSPPSSRRATAMSRSKQAHAERSTRREIGDAAHRMPEVAQRCQQIALVDQLLHGVAPDSIGVRLLRAGERVATRTRCRC